MLFKKTYDELDTCGSDEIGYDDISYTSGSRCLMCGTSRRPDAGRCHDCGYLWYKSDGRSFGSDNWHNYSILSYNHPELLVRPRR